MTFLEEESLKILQMIVTLSIITAVITGTVGDSLWRA